VVLANHLHQQRHSGFVLPPDDQLINVGSWNRKRPGCTITVKPAVNTKEGADSLMTADIGFTTSE
jgi:hypothetical protein